MIDKIKKWFDDDKAELSIKKRLSISNVLIIIVPVLVTVIILALIMNYGYKAFYEFYLPGRGISESDVQMLGEHYKESIHSFRVLGVVLIIGILFVITVEILFLNRFLTNFVFKRIRQPLDMIEAGVKRIQNGNLEKDINYKRLDEFKPVCDSIDLMQHILKKSANQSASEVQSRKELLAGISHDLRSPLTSVRAYTEALLDGVVMGEEIQKQYLNKILEKELDIERMVEQLFMISKMDLDSFPVEMKNLCLKDNILKAVEEHKMDDLVIELNIPENLIVRADETLLKRIIVNLMENTRKYKVKHVATFKIEAEKRENHVHVHFSDDGPGVEEEQLQKLFTTFYRTDPSRKNPARGSGLGLAIVKKAVQRMNGSVYASNGKECGLVISLILMEGVNE